MNWHNLIHARSVYQSLGYLPIEVPWIVPTTTAGITAVSDRKRLRVYAESGNYDVLEGELIASGEVGYLEIRRNLERDTRYQTLTPCFRDEPSYVPGVTQREFMKLELIHVRPEDDSTAMLQMIGHARMFYRVFTDKVKVEETRDGLDLTLNGLEIGSFGVREHDGFRWVYGTGIAEPRFSSALNRFTEERRNVAA